MASETSWMASDNLNTYVAMEIPAQHQLARWWLEMKDDVIVWIEPNYRAADVAPHRGALKSRPSCFRILEWPCCILLEELLKQNLLVGGPAARSTTARPRPFFQSFRLLSFLRWQNPLPLCLLFATTVSPLSCMLHVTLKLPQLASLMNSETEEDAAIRTLEKLIMCGPWDDPLILGWSWSAEWS